MDTVNALFQRSVEGVDRGREDLAVSSRWTMAYAYRILDASALLQPKSLMS
jgi:hypothetical protein